MTPRHAFAAEPVHINAAGGIVPNKNWCPLAGRRILYTAPPSAARKISDALVRVGARPLWTPVLQTSLVNDPAALADLDDALLRLSEFNFVLLPNAIAIAAIAARLHSLLGIDDLHMVAGFLTASGALFVADAEDALAVKPYLGVNADLIPLSTSPAGFCDIIRERSFGNLDGKRVLVPSPFPGQQQFDRDRVHVLVEILAKAGATVVSPPAYSAQLRERNESAMEFDAIRSGLIDALYVTSDAEAGGLSASLEDTTSETTWGRTLVLVGPLCNMQAVQSYLKVENVVKVANPEEMITKTSKLIMNSGDKTVLALGN